MHRDDPHLLEPDADYVPRHRSTDVPAEIPVDGSVPPRLDPVEVFLSMTGPRPGDLPRIRSYDDLGRDRIKVEEQPSDFERVFTAAADGPATEPLLGRKAREWRPGSLFANVVSAFLGGGLAAAIVCSPLTAMAVENARDIDRVWTAQFNGTGVAPISVADVTCDDLFTEIVKGSTVVSRSPAGYPPMKVTDPVVLDEQLEEIAALTKADIGREAIVCQGKAYWPGKTPRRIVSVLTVAGGESGPSTMSSKVVASPKKPARAGKKAQKKT